jgi:hypothetical protein
MQIADWLSQLGMSEYKQCFVENGISFAALRHLTDQDLKDIGVLLGHRRIMFAAISKMPDAAPAAVEPPKRAAAAQWLALCDVTQQSSPLLQCALGHSFDFTSAARGAAGI